MDKPSKSDNSDVSHKLAAVVVVIFLSFGGWDMIRDYLRSKKSSEKLATLTYHGEWSVGEYRECDSMNLRHMEKPEVACSGASPLDNPRIFNIEFKGGPTYDSRIADGTVFTWLCRRTNGDVSFSCAKQPIHAEKQPESVSSPPPITSPLKSELSKDDVSYFRRRNECEQRFYDKKMYQVNGVSIGEACKQNPELKP
jgi:hypothetical protein